MLHRMLLAILLVSLPAAHAQAQMAGGPEQARPWLGVAIDKGSQGVLVKDVLAGTPAEGAGLKAGDQITAIDATPVKEPKELMAAVLASGVGNTVTVHWLRAGAETVKKVKLVAKPDQLEVLRAQLVGKPAPPFDLKVVHGSGTGKSDGLKGHVALVEFWATWCPACRSTHARLSEFAQKHKGQVAVVAISDEDEATIRDYAKLVHPHFTLLADPRHETMGPWMVSAIPQLAVLDKNGKVAFATVGAGEYLDEALQEAEKLLKGP